ncbi:Apoptosis-resistant E3 ubiquitin protein ligase 1 [Mizuhopecten yessoensis]|uniref:Apoptosis-resistant E3 ubiquitin protein ligase 1 n=1 Tax=Mizuhopecten yessoensis TaxID=6573 RepID=A0A210Q0D1_MIZYE|nr:Apoptosis-resistant E3 ubiquitin protein ligase 1 [Mizuhopecten yessoensis]
MGAFCNQVTGMLRQTTVEPILFLYMFATFLEFPVSQDLIYTRVCLEKFSNSTYICDNLGNNTLKEEGDVVQKEASSWIMYNNVAYTVPAVISVTLFLGPWGDRLGRKIPMMLTIIGNMLLTVCNLIVSSHTDISIKYILIGKVINGMTGGFIGLMMSVYSYIGHISSSKNRTSRRRPPNVVVYLFLEVFVLVILMICTSGENDILLLYTKLPQFNWSQMRYGFFKAGENFGRGLAVLTLLPVLRYKFNTRDSILILFGLVSKATGLLLLGLATQTWQLYLVPVISVLQGFPSAGLRSSMSGLVDTTEQDPRANYTTFQEQDEPDNTEQTEQIQNTSQGMLH